MGHVSLVSLALLASATVFAQSWEAQTSGTTAGLRGISAVDDQVAWASGTGGAWLRTTDGGAHWSASSVPGAEALDFRGVRALDASTAWLMSAGPGDKSRIYRTTDAGAHWELLYTNPDPKGFFDDIAFRDAKHGMVLGDPVDGRFVVLYTSDGGATWERRPTPPAMPNEGAFAASNSSLVLSGNRDAWFVTGGPGGARVFRTSDAGRTWTVSTTPIRNEFASAGIFSLAFGRNKRAIIAGGDYGKPAETASNVAISSDGGHTWAAPTGPRPNGYRSSVIYFAPRKAWIATGTSGSDISVDNGMSWKQFDGEAYNALSAAGKALWAVGPNGRIARLR